MKTAEILVVDDDPKIRNLLRRGFEGEGIVVFESGNKADTLDILSTHRVDLVTLDLDLGEDDGLDVAKAIRKQSSVPIIMITAKGDVIDRVVGLEIGADDYIAKPFHLREVLARVKSVLRRAGDAPQPARLSPVSPCMQFDGMKTIPAQMLLFDRDNTRVELTSGEFKLLGVFLDRPKRVLSREQLMDLTGGHTYAPLDRTIDNQIARLRKKIERNAAAPRLISTIRGIGYSFTCDVNNCDHYPPSNNAESAAARSD